MVVTVGWDVEVLDQVCRMARSVRNSEAKESVGLST